MGMTRRSSMSNCKDCDEVYVGETNFRLKKEKAT
jgi:hypothetical protein